MELILCQRDRDEWISISIEEGTTSLGRHARLIRKGDAVYLVDPSSRRGTRVNDRRVRKARLRDGDRVSCGEDRFQVVLDPEEVPEPVPESNAEQPRVRLRLVRGGPPQIWLLERPSLSLGSLPSNDIVLEGEGVSRQHASLTLEGGAWILEDDGSRNGILFAGQTVTRRELQHGDEFKLGSLVLCIEMEGAGTSTGASRAKWGPALAAVGLLAAIAFVDLSAAKPDLEVPFPSSTSTPQPDPEDILRGTRELNAGEYRAAHRVFRRAAARASKNERLPRIMERIANLWAGMERRRDGLALFRWEKAASLLEEARTLPDLPGETATWIDVQIDWVARGLEAHASLARAEARGDEVGGLMEANKSGSPPAAAAEVVRALRQALTSYDQVDPESPFGKNAREGKEALQAEVCRHLLETADELTRAEEPDWESALALLNHADPLATKTEQRSRLRTLSDTCHVNHRDENRYAVALEILRSRDHASYQDALAMLEQVGPRSRIHDRAQTWAAWVEADERVRRAQALYEGGDAKGGLQLLQQALDYQLEPDAQELIGKHRERWAQVLEAYQLSLDRYRQGDVRGASKLLENLLSLEPDDRNRYNQLAREQMAFIERSATSRRDEKLRKGVDALQSGDFAAAAQSFTALRTEQDLPEDLLARIGAEVLRETRERDLLAAARRTLHLDRISDFPRLRDMFELLVAWIPEGTPERAAAARHLRVVEKRLRLWEEAAR